MPETMSPSEKVALKPCPFCGGEAAASQGGSAWFVHCETADCHEGHNDFMRSELEAAELWNRRTALASSGDHAELARLAEEVKRTSFWREARDARDYVIDEPCEGEDYGAEERPVYADWVRKSVLALIAENAALRAERDQVAGGSIWWKGVIGDGSHQPSGEVRSIKHLHPAMVKPIYEANKGTAVADVIAGLIFSLAINQNREQFLVSDANERRTEAERKLAEAVGLLGEAASELESEVEARYDGVKDHPAMTPKYDRDMDTVTRIRTFLSSKEAERG